MAQLGKWNKDLKKQHYHHLFSYDDSEQPRIALHFGNSGLLQAALWLRSTDEAHVIWNREGTHQCSSKNFQ